MLLAGHAKGVHCPFHLDKTDFYSKALWCFQSTGYLVLFMKIIWRFNEGISTTKKSGLFNRLILIVLNLPWDLHPNVF